MALKSNGDQPDSADIRFFLRRKMPPSGAKKNGAETAPSSSLVPTLHQVRGGKTP
jgi:hypothetical protein